MVLENDDSNRNNSVNHYDCNGTFCFYKNGMIFIVIVKNIDKEK